MERIWKHRLLMYTLVCWTFLFIRTMPLAASIDFSGIWDNDHQTTFYVYQQYYQGAMHIGGFITSGCGNLNVNFLWSTITSAGVIDMYSEVCSALPPYQKLTDGSYARFTNASWHPNHDGLSLEWAGYTPDHIPTGDGGSVAMWTYPDSESSDTSRFNPPDDWSGATYAWKGTAITPSSGRSFGGRPFFEADNTSSANDTCWFALVPLAWRYDYLNKGAGGPDPNNNNPPSSWRNLNVGGSIDSSWDDYVGWTPLALITYYRQNSPSMWNGSLYNGYCSATVGQLMYMVAKFSPTNWTYRPYQANSHVITIWNSNISLYNTSSTTNWTFQSKRGGASNKYKVWPIINPPTGITATVVSGPQIQLSWNSAGGDANEYSVWRRVAGGTGQWLSYVTSTNYTDTNVSANTDYYYCIRASHKDTDPIWSNTMHTWGPCPANETHVSTYPQPTSLSISPGIVHRLQEDKCFTMTVGNGANMTVDLRYTLNGFEHEDYHWPTLNGNGQAFPCVYEGTPGGVYNFTGIRNTLNTDGPWVPVNAQIMVF